MTAMPQKKIAPSTSATFPARTLPGWTYDNGEFFELERLHLLLKSWQVVCHVSELSRPGDYATLEFMGERALVVRGEDNEIRAFHNVCRHRAAAVARGDTGNCGHALRCFYHGWTYGLDGRLKAVPGESSFPDLDKTRMGLKPLAHEIYIGFVFVRFAGDGPGVSERLAPYGEELAAYRATEMVPISRRWTAEINVDWKNVMDNYLEGYHVPIGHPGLFRLFGNNYEVETQDGFVGRAVGMLRDKESSNWSERHYQRLLPEVEHLPKVQRKSWRYYKLLPNVAFDIYPDLMDFFQVVPLAPGRTQLRVRAFGLPTEDRRLKAARRLNFRINIQVQREDEELIDSVQKGLATSAYGSGIFSEKEVCLRQFHELVRRTLPVAQLAEPPAPGTMAQVNAAMAG